MPDSLELVPDLLPDAALSHALEEGLATGERAVVLARLRRRAETNRKSLEQQTREFERMYEEAASRLPPEGLIQLATKIHEGETNALELLRPWIDTLRQAIAHAPGQDAATTQGRAHLGELIEISEAWLALYRDVRERLSRLAAKRASADREILRARPVKGEIDHAALTREIVARYPKILAALAK